MSVDTTGTAAPAAPPVLDGAAKKARRYVLLLLLAVYISNYADRQIVNVLGKQIIDDLHISNTAFGALSGLMFGVLYATLGIPLAMLADRTSRKWVLTVSIVVWSVMTSLCGAATSFLQLALARIGVGVGEAGGSPPSHSMISDLFPASQRGTALAVYSLGVPFGVFVGSIVGGQIGAAFGWRAAFYVLGVPGLILAVLVAITLREPPRGQSDAAQLDGQKAPPLMDVARFMLSQKSLVKTIIGAAMITAVGYGSLAWIAVFLQNSHGMDLKEASAYLGLLNGIVAGIGTFLGGYLADILAKRNIGWSTWVVTAAILLVAPFGAAVFIIDDKATVLWLLALPALVGGLYLAPTFALIQNLVGVRMRSTAAALMLFVINLVGLGLGPLLVGVLSDVLKPAFAEHAERYALLIFSALNIWGAYYYWIAPKTLKADLERALTA